MSIFVKSKKKQSSRHQIAIEGVREGILLLPNHHYRAILHISSINFELKSEAEQDAIIDTYQSFLNSLATPLQIVVRVREMDMDKYLVDFAERVKNEPEEIYREQIENYTNFVRSLISTNKILTRHFYVVIPYNDKEKDFEVVKEQLSLTLDIVGKGLARLGMQSRQLNSLEVLDMFYSFYDPGLAKRQPLSAQTMQLLTESYL
ncbi:MAG: TraC family protein [Patescibacteria group bacterium]